MSYQLVCDFVTGYKYSVELTKPQAIHVLSLWGSQYNIEECYNHPIYSPSGNSRIEMVSAHTALA
jgi:hypothetical protein